MWRVLAALAALAAIGAAWFLFAPSKAPATVFVRPTVERIESLISTNGKAEPVEWTTVRAETGGLIETLPVNRGDRVGKGQAIASIEARQARADLAQAEARIAQAQAEIATFESGGRSAELAEIDGALSRARTEQTQQMREVETLERLVAKKAATASSLRMAREIVERTQSQIAALTAKRTRLVSPGDVAAARARLRDAEAAAKLAHQLIEVATLRSPVTGVAYQVDVRRGAFLNAGDPVASVGTVNRLRVIVYVDEPELGRVRTGLPVTIEWDALPGRTWKGVVDKLPTQIVALGTRQVGEVHCLIDNADGTLLPGTNVDVSILAASEDRALTVPKECVRREGGPQGSREGIYVLDGDRVRWRAVETGLASLTRIAIKNGLREGESVALPGETPLSDGAPVSVTQK